MPTFNPRNFTLSNKSYVPANGTSIDARSRFFDETLQIPRDYQSTAEVIAYLDTTSIRTGGFSIWVNVGGVLNGDGTFTGGTQAEYYFRKPYADGDLVVKASGSVTVDSVPTDGSSNAVSSNGVFDALQSANAVGIVSKYSAVGDGETDDTVAFQSAIDALCTSKGGALLLVNGRNYKIEGEITFPDFIDDIVPAFRIFGNGARITTSSTGTLFKKLVSDQTDAETDINSRILFYDIDFYGTGIANQNAIKIQASYGTGIYNCNFSNFDTAIDIQFGLKTDIFNCFFNQNLSYDVRLRCGDWTGATTSNSQSNHSVVNSSRFFCGTGQLAAIQVLGSSGCHLVDNIIEGFNPVRCIDFDAQGSTTVKHFFVDNIHIENVPTEAGICLKPNGGSCVINSYWSQLGHTMIKMKAGGQGNIIVDNLMYIPDGANFKAENGLGVWSFPRLNFSLLNSGTSAFWTSYFDTSGINLIPAEKYNYNTGGYTDFIRAATISAGGGNIELTGSLGRFYVGAQFEASIVALGVAKFYNDTQFIPMTQTQRDALGTVASGSIVNNSTAGKLQCYMNGIWNDLF